MRLRAAMGAVSANLGARHCDMDAAIVLDLLHQLLVEFAFEFTDLPAAEAGDMNMVTRPVTLVKMAFTPKMEQVEFVNQAMPFEKVDGPIDGDASDARINFLSAAQDLTRIQMATSSFHHLK